MSTGNKKAFTLVELLVVIATIALLMSILMPILSVARAQGKAAVCKSNIRQLVLANIGYATENDGSYAPAALDIIGANKHRWHGVRDDIDSPFDATKGPLAGYLADGGVKKCPEKVNFRHGVPWDWDFEDGCGGYGYNMTYIGSRIWERYTAEKCKVTTKDSEVGRPSETVMFADTAMAKLDSGRPYYLEYSFAEPPYFVVNGEPVTSWGYASPSIHFRHRDKANIGWADGHIGARRMADFDGKNVYGVDSADMKLGWFEPVDNAFFDLK
ncbi:MAG: type II secretion system GspH family protein [Sedimentisphaerales bacterium]|nr:type II secretion system GspH family protein [Sedimentisphaerales bacterium]